MKTHNHCSSNSHLKLILACLITASVITFTFKTSCAQEGKDKGTIKADTVIHWMTFTQAIEANKNYPKKKIFIDLFTDWCGWGKKMDADTFSNPILAQYMNEHYYPVKFNAERSDTVEFQGKQFVNPSPSTVRSTHQLAYGLLNGKLSYPSYVFLDENFNMLTIVSGYYEVAPFEPILHYFGDNQQNEMPYQQFEKTFKGNFK